MKHHCLTKTVIACKQCSKYLVNKQASHKKAGKNREDASAVRNTHHG